MLDAIVALRVGREGDYHVRQRLMLTAADVEWFGKRLGALLAGGGDGVELANVEGSIKLAIERAEPGLGTEWEARGFVAQSFGARLTFWEVPLSTAALAELRTQAKSLLAAFPPRFEQFRPPAG